MPTVAEILKAANVADEVISGLDPKVTGALESHFTTAQQQLETAAETLRMAGVKEKQVKDYVATYGADLTKLGDLQAQNETLVAYMKKLKEKGFDGIEIPNLDTKPIVTANASAFDEKALLGKVGVTMSTVLNLNNKYQRVFGQPIPDDIDALADEAKSHSMNLMEWAEKKYKFSEKEAATAQAARQKEVDDAVAKAVEAERKKAAERTGSNPNLRPGQSSSSSLIPQGKPEDFHAADANIPRRQRQARMLEKIHKDIAAANGAA